MLVGCYFEIKMGEIDDKSTADTAYLYIRVPADLKFLLKILVGYIDLFKGKQPLFILCVVVAGEIAVEQ